MYFKKRKRGKEKGGTLLSLLFFTKLNLISDNVVLITKHINLIFRIVFLFSYHRILILTGTHTITGIQMTAIFTNNITSQIS